MKHKKLKIALQRWNLQCTENWITDGRVMIFKKDYFSYGKDLDILVETGKPFQITQDRVLKFEFEEHKIEKLEKYEFSEYEFSGLLETDYEGKTALFYAKENPAKIEKFLWAMIEPLIKHAVKFEISPGHMMRLFDSEGHRFALVMGSINDTKNKYLQKLEGAA